MKKYLVINKKTQEICGKFDSKSEAADEMLGFIEEHNEDCLLYTSPSPRDS